MPKIRAGAALEAAHVDGSSNADSGIPGAIGGWRHRYLFLATIFLIEMIFTELCVLAAYMNLYVPLFKSLNLPPFLLHWFHAVGEILRSKHR